MGNPGGVERASIIEDAPGAAVSGHYPWRASLYTAPGLLLASLDPVKLLIVT